MSGRSSRATRPTKLCARCDRELDVVHLPGDPHEICAECAISTDPGAELAFREGLHGGGATCRSCGGEHCPHYACTTSGGIGYCDNCTGDDDV